MQTIKKMDVNPAKTGGIGFLQMLMINNISRLCKSHIRRFIMLFMMIYFMAGSLTGYTVCTVHAVAIAEDRPDPGQTLAVFQDVEGWIINWNQPGEYKLPENVTGVWVAIRRAGRIMGQSQDMNTAFDKEVSSLCLPRAVRLAMDRAEQAARGKGDPAEQQDRQIAFQSEPNTIELQFAHIPRRIRATSMSAVVSHIRPGIDGVLLQKKDKVMSCFPGQMLADGLNPSQALLSLLATEDINLAQLGEGLASGAIRAWAFEVDHITQLRRGDPGSFMYRGTHVISTTDMNTASLYKFADNLVSHLFTHRLPADMSKPYSTFLGQYDIELNLYEPFVCTNRDQAVCVYALIRYANMVNFSSAKRDKAYKLAMEILSGLNQSTSSNSGNNADAIKEAGTAAMIMITINYIRDNNNSLLSDRGRTYETWLDDLYDHCANIVNGSFSNDNGFNKDLSVSDRAKCALASGSAPAIDAAWQTTSDKLQPDLLPWLGWAEDQLADKSNSGKLRSAIGLKNLRKQIWETQYTGNNVNGTTRSNIEPDLIGCLEYEDSGTVSSWKTARPLAFAASVIADARLTNSDEQIKQILNATASFRFLKQLSVREDDQYRISDFSRAQGGVKTSIISTQVNPEATAVTLIAVIEMLENLDRLYSDKK